MHGTVDLRKNILVFVPDSDPSTSTALRKISPFLRGDRVVHSNDSTRLVSRTPVVTIAVVESSRPLILYFPTFGSSASMPHCEAFSTIRTGDRLTVSLLEDGRVEYIAGWPNDPSADAAWIRSAVQYITPRETPATTRGSPLYTQEGVIDHSDLDTFTIDPTSSVDFDDAISVDLANQTVYVHIVDIAHAALTESEQTKLRSQCLTLYLANEATEHLLDAVTASNSLSLIVGQPRSVITVAMKIADGCITKKEIYRSTIVVKRRYNYEEVATHLRDHTATPALEWLAELSAARSETVNYNLTLPSLRFTMDVSSGLPVSLISECTNDAAHSLVATTMIMANLVVSQHLSAAGLVLPNRFHAALRGIPVSDITGDSVVDSFILVKKFARARYSVDERGHFGLGLTDYVHFTSPMRRYADVLVHNLLAGVRYEDMETEVEVMNRQSGTMKGLQELHERCKLASWVKAHPTESYDVYCTDVKAVGIQWFLPALSLNGFTHVSRIHPPQRWAFLDDILTSVTGSCIRVGSTLRGCLDNINPVTLSITIDVTV
jgi:ribonuclease R